MSNASSIEDIAECAANWLDEYGDGTVPYSEVLNETSELVRQYLATAWDKGVAAARYSEKSAEPLEDNPYRKEPQ